MWSMESYDSISLHLAGLPVVTGVTGKSLHPDLSKPLRKRFIILPDEGEGEAIQLANKLGWRASVRKIEYPDGTKTLMEYAGHSETKVITNDWSIR